jgi:virginiamycin B lyase
MQRRLPKILIIVLFVFAVAVLAAARESVVITEWDVPTPGSFPHDPAVSRDGGLWYTGMLSDTLGKLDPSTGKIREYRVPPGSRPHGLVEDGKGMIWFTANQKAYIGRLDPVSGDVKEYAMPDPEAADPHTPIFDHKGMLWFTVQSGNFVGRLDPSSGAIILKKPPTLHSRPYGIVVDSKGTPFFCEFSTNKLGSISPDTLKIKEYDLPQGARPRRLAITPDDMVYYTDYARGRLGRLDPSTGKVGDWPSPGGADSRPYGIAATPDGKIWYSESGVNPNTIVRFDPKTKTFEAWPIPSGGGVVRHMVSTPEGDLYIACSGKNKVGVVKTPR